MGEDKNNAVHTRNRIIEWQDTEVARVQADGLSVLDIMRGIRDGTLPPPPIARLIGFNYIEAEPGHIVIELQPEQSLEYTSGTLHGAVAAAMLDTAMCAAAGTLLPAHKRTITLDLTISYLKPLTIESGPIRAIARVVDLAERTAYAAGEVRDGAGSLAAHAVGVCSVITSLQTQSTARRALSIKPGPVVDNPAHIGRDGLLSALLLGWSRTVEMSIALHPYGFTMKHQPAQLDETMALISADHAEMVNTLATALAIESDRSVQVQLQKLARVSDGQSFLVSQLRSRAWLKLGNDRGVTVHRGRVDGLKTVDLALALGSNPGLTDALQLALSGTALATASELLDPMWEMDAMPSREQYAVLRRWSPLLEQLAYKSSTRILNFLDALRPKIIKHLTLDAQGTDPRLSAYWSGLHVMAHLTLLASEPEARPWLTDMASQFKWTKWTPTFPLLRERTAWLAACAARSAVAFGEPVIGKYLATLSQAEHPMKAFDALFGLVAIALDRKDLASSILSEIRSLKQAFVDRQVAHVEYFRMEYDDAMRTISEAGAGQQTSVEMRELGWGFQSRVGLATRAALCTDPASFSASGRFVGFSILPVVVSAAPEEHYCATAPLWRELDISAQDIGAIIGRAWVPNSRESASYILQ